MNTVALAPVVWDVHRERIIAWLREPHVRRWWVDTEGWIDTIRETSSGNHSLITLADRPVGYMRWQTADREVLDTLGLHEVRDGGIDIDIFLGEGESLGKGVGPRALQLLLTRLVESGAPQFGLCPSVENLHAIRAFEKAGFRKLKEFEDPSAGPCWVMVRDRQDVASEPGNVVRS